MYIFKILSYRIRDASRYPDKSSFPERMLGIPEIFVFLHTSNKVKFSASKKKKKDLTLTKRFNINYGTIINA